MQHGQHGEKIIVSMHPFSQNMLIKLVCLHPMLCWLRSDLNDESIAVLCEERPEVTLVDE